MKLKIGVVGYGFAKGFIPLFQAHPDVVKVAVTDLVAERRNEMAKDYGIKDVYDSFDDMLERGKDLNCIALFSSRYMHGPMVIKALKAGKHVYSAVPLALEIEEIEEILDILKTTRLNYMMGETCYYYPCAMFCREMYQSGRFGDFVYAEAQYYHDMAHGFYKGFERGHTAFAKSKDDWKTVAGTPPMHYPTHSMGMVLSALDTYVTQVSCFGYEDNIDPDIFGKGVNLWDNPFVNETALMKLANGGICRISEYRRVGWRKPSSHVQAMYGNKGGYEGSVGRYVMVDEFGDRAIMSDVSDRINPYGYVVEKDNPESIQKMVNGGYHDDLSEVQFIRAKNLPEEYKGLPNGHMGTHKFLVDDFVRSTVSGKLAPCNAWESARYMLPGIIAHESAMRGGETMNVPNLGNPPDDWDKLIL